MLDALFLVANRETPPHNTDDFGNFYYSHVDRIFQMLKNRGYNVDVNYRPKQEIPSKLYLYTNCLAINDFPWMKKYGKRVYCSHGAGIFKRYGWYPKQHREHDVIVFTSEGMREKYEMCHPQVLLNKYHKVLGYSKYDKYFEQRESGTARERLVQKYKIDDPSKPIVLFAPTWGEIVNDFGLNLVNYPNIIFAPRSGYLSPGITKNMTYEYDKSLEIAGSDVVVTDISALGTEAGKLGKPIVQLCVSTYASTAMKSPTDLIIPGLEKYGPYIIGEQVFETDPTNDFSYWDKKIDDALKNQPHKGRDMWSDLCLQYDDGDNTKRIVDYLEMFLND